jgi:hypothetical protein
MFKGQFLRKSFALFVWLISHQPAVLFSLNKPAINNQPTVLFSQNKPAINNQSAVLFSQNKSTPAIRHQPNKQAACLNKQLLHICSHGKVHFLDDVILEHILSHREHPNHQRMHYHQ